MGIFDLLKGKTQENNAGNTIRMTDIFTEEEIKEIKDLITRHRMGWHYKTVYHQTCAKTMIGYMANSRKAYSIDKMNNFIKIADTIMIMEPSLKPVLEEGILKINAIASGEDPDQ